MKKNIKGALSVGYRLHGENFTYEIDDILGQGSFGITYLAHILFEGKLGSLKKAKQSVAIKEFYMCDINTRDESFILNGSHSETFINYHRRFKKEAENLAQMDHPGIVDVMEIFEANGTSYYVMDYLPGGTFDDLINEHRSLASAKALRYILKISEALDYMHAQRMLHLDLKPSNIGMSETKEPVLIDFGLSKVFNENGLPETSTSIGGGTPGYSPLEQMNFNPEKGLAPTLDIYALGGTLYKALTGVTPPYASHVLEDGDILTDRMAEHHVSPEVMELVNWAMSPRKKDRPQSVESFAERARCVLENLGDCNEDKEEGGSETDPETIDSFKTDELIPGDILNNYEEYADYGFEGLVAVKKGSRWGYLDAEGREVIPCQYTTANMFCDGIAIVSRDGKWGYIDKTGKEIIPVIHQAIGTFGNFDDEIVEASLGAKRGYYNQKGDIVIPFEYDKAYPYSEGLAPVQKNGKFGFVDSGNNVVIPFIYEDVWSFTEGLAMAKLNGKWGFIDKSTRVIVPFEYDEVSMYNDGIASVNKNGKWGCVDRSGNIIIPIIHDQRFSFNVDEEDDEYAYMNAKTDPSSERSAIYSHHFEDIHGYRCRINSCMRSDQRNALEILLEAMSQNVLPGSHVHYHPCSYMFIDNILYGLRTVGIIRDKTNLKSWVCLLDGLRDATGLPFRFGSPEEVLAYADSLKGTTLPLYERMFALDPTTSKFSIINIVTKEVTDFDLNDLPHANILLVCDVMHSPLYGVKGFEEYHSFGYAFFKRPNEKGCEIVDNEMNVVRSSTLFDYHCVWHDEDIRHGNTKEIGQPLYKVGQPYIGNIFYILEDERETSKWPEIAHVGPSMELVPGFYEINEDTDLYEK